MRKKEEKKTDENTSEEPPKQTKRDYLKKIQKGCK
jgi:hypothetical protein